MSLPRGGSIERWRLVHLQINMFTNLPHPCRFCATSCPEQSPEVWASHVACMISYQRLAVDERLPRSKRWHVGSHCRHNNPRTFLRYTMSRQAINAEIHLFGSLLASRVKQRSFELTSSRKRRFWLGFGKMGTLQNFAKNDVETSEASYVHRKGGALTGEASLRVLVTTPSDASS